MKRFHAHLQALELDKKMAKRMQTHSRTDGCIVTAFMLLPIDRASTEIIPLFGIFCMGVVIGLIFVNGYQYYRHRSTKKLTQHETLPMPPATQPSLNQPADDMTQSALLAMLSHEIRTPLNTILGMVELPMRNIRLPRESRQHLSQALQAIEALQNILDNILDLSQLQLGKASLKSAPVNLASLFDNLAKLYHVVTTQKGLDFHYELSIHERRSVVISEGKLRQILNNLLANAVKFTDKGQISLIVRSYPAQPNTLRLTITINDTGIGISEQELHHLFEPFSQASEHIQHRFGGTGLGLYISKQLTQLMGGSLAIESLPGEGTCVDLHFEFPLAMEEAGTEGKNQKGPHKQEIVFSSFANNMSALIVDDSDSIRHLLKRQLERMGFAVTVASSGLEAEQRWFSGQFNLILVDYHMPGFSGPEVVRHLRALESQYHDTGSAIIGFTADTEPESENAFIQAGASMCLNKPVRYSLLYSAVRSLVHDKHAATTHPSLYWLDRHKLKELSSHNSHFEKTFLLSVKENNHVDINVAQNAYAKHDFDRLFQALHRLSGALRLICHNPLASQLDTLIQAVRKREHKTIGPLFEDTLNKLHALDDEITHYLAILEKANTEKI